MTTCGWCGMIHGTLCPMVKAIEYFADGVTVKRVEFKVAADYSQQHVSVPSVFGRYPSTLGGEVDVSTVLLKNVDIKDVRFVD